MEHLIDFFKGLLLILGCKPKNRQFLAKVKSAAPVEVEERGYTNVSPTSNTNTGDVWGGGAYKF
jgi:hypothetical protein